jgi:hypothetical protein
VVLLTGLLITGCTATTAGTPEPAGTAAPAPPAAAAPDPPGTCVVVAGRGSVSMRGSGRVSTVNGRTSLTCGSGPALAIGEIGADGVALEVSGSRLTVAVGDRATVGPYTVAVDQVADGQVRMRVSPPR